MVDAAEEAEAADGGGWQAGYGEPSLQLCALPARRLLPTNISLSCWPTASGSIAQGT
jgi:hypothetical protein